MAMLRKLVLVVVGDANSALSFQAVYGADSKPDDRGEVVVLETQFQFILPEQYHCKQRSSAGRDPLNEASGGIVFDEIRKAKQRESVGYSIIEYVSNHMGSGTVTSR